MATKVNTRFTERSKHQLTEKGTVFEHELSTLPDLASITKLGNFQIPVYKSGNLVITRDTEQAIRRNVKGQPWARNESGDTWNGDLLSQYPLDEDSSDATAIFNYDYSKLEHFVYYGSAMELLRVSVGNIVSNFPGELYAMTEQSDSTLVPVQKQYRDIDGTWKYAGVNVCGTGSTQLPSAWTQVVKNGDFSSGMTNWMTTEGVTNTITDDSITFSAPGGSSNLYEIGQSITLIPGHKYYVRFKYKVTGATQLLAIVDPLEHVTLPLTDEMTTCSFIGNYYNFNLFAFAVYGDDFMLSVDRQAGIMCIDMTEIGNALGLTFSTTAEFEAWADQNCVDLDSYHPTSASGPIPGGCTTSLSFDALVANPFSINIYADRCNIYADDFSDLRYFCGGRHVNYDLVIDGVRHPIDTYTKQYLIYNAIKHCYEVSNTSPGKSCFKPGEPLCLITLTTEDGLTLQIVPTQGNNNEIFYLTTAEAIGTHIRPKQAFLDIFYTNLEPFEHYLLNPYSSPRYMAQFVVRHFGDTGEYNTLESFVFPTGDGGYNIAIEGPGFEYYIQRLSEVALSYDENITDNLWRAMVHESIKAFDWTTDPAAKETYEEGAGKLEKVLKVIAAFFDRIKRDIDNLDHTETVTYSGKDNVANYSLSDLVELKGIEPVNVIPLQHTVIADNMTAVTVGDESICSNICYIEEETTLTGMTTGATFTPVNFYEMVVEERSYRRFPVGETVHFFYNGSRWYANGSPTSLGNYDIDTHGRVLTGDNFTGRRQDDDVDIVVGPRVGVTVTDIESYIAKFNETVLTPGATGSTTLSHNGTAWSTDPAEYGITLTGYPASGDTVTLTYTRGTVVIVTPGMMTDITERYFTTIDSGVTPYSGSSLGYFEVCCGVQVPAQPGEEIKATDRYYVGYNGRKLYFDCDNKLNMITPTGGTVQYDKPLTGTTINLPYYVEGETEPRYSDYEIYREQDIVTRTSTFASDTPLTGNEFNYEFLRRLKLNAPGILRKKGTIAGVEEILSLFNLKSQRFVDRYCGDKTIAADYKIEESTLYTAPITDTYDTRYRMPYYDYLNTTKSYSYNTDNFKAGVYDAYRGLPVKPVNFYITSEGNISRQKYDENGRARRINHRLVYPYFDKSLPHDGNLYYQMYGGWLNKDISFSKDGLTLCRNRYPYNFTVTLRNVYAVSCPDNLAGVPANKLYDGFYCEVEDSSKKYLNVNGVLYEIFYETKNITNSSTLANGYYDCAYIKITLGPDGKLVGDKFYDGIVYISDPCYNGFLNPVNTAVLASDTTQKVYLYRVDTTGNKIPVGSQILSTAHVGEVSIDLYKSAAGVISEVAISELVTDNDEYSSYWKLEDKTKGMQYAMTNTPAPQYDGGWVRLTKDSDDVAYLNTIITRKEANNPHSARVGYDNGLAYIDRFASLFYDAYPDNINETCLQFSKESYSYEDFGFTNLYDLSGATIAYLDTKAHAFCDKLNTSGLTTIYGDTGNTLFDIVRHGTGDTYPTLEVDDSDPRRIINTKYVDITFFIPPITGSSAEIDRYKYYDSVIVAYLEQVLPPTIICNINYEIAEEKCSVKVHTLPLNAGPTTGTGVYDCGTSVDISASDGLYYEFEKWSDGYTGSTRTVTAAGDVTYFAKYHGKDMVLKVGTDNLAQGTVTPYQPTGDTAEYGSVVRLMALPSAQYRFDHWRVDGVDSTLYNSIIDVEIDKSVTEYIAVFRPRTDTFVIQASSNNDEWGYVTGGKDDALYGEILRLEAIPYDCCYGFAYWCDDTGNTNPIRFVTAVTDASYIAVFTARTYTLTLGTLPVGQNWGTVSGGGEYECGYVTIQATPADGCYFVGWSDGDTNATRQIYLNADTTLNAIFAHYAELVVKNHPNSPAGCNFIVNGAPYGANWGTEYDNARVKTGDSFTVTPQPAMGYIVGVWTYDFYDVNPGSTADYSSNLPNNGVATLQLTGNTTPVNSAVLTIECYGCNRNVILLYDEYMTYQAITRELVTGTTPYSYNSLTATTVIKGATVSGSTTSSYGTTIQLSALTIDSHYMLNGWEVKTDSGMWLDVDNATGEVINSKGSCNNDVIIRPILKPRGRVVTIDKYDHGYCGLIGFEITGQTMQDVDTLSTGVEECESITLKATPCAGCTFDGWYDMGGMLVSTATAYTITPTGDVTYRPKFTCADITITLNTAGADPVTCGLVSANTVAQSATALTYTISPGTSSTVKAIVGDACSCRRFVEWKNNGVTYSTDNPLTLQGLSSDLTLTAQFGMAGPQSVTALTNNSTFGLVKFDQGATAEASATTTVPCNSSVTLRAMSVGCGIFDHWVNVNDPTETYDLAVVTVPHITGATAYRAVFVARQYKVDFVFNETINRLQYNVNNTGFTTLPLGQTAITVKCGDLLSVKMSNNNCCYSFLRWIIDDTTYTDPIHTVTITNDLTIEEEDTDQFEITCEAVDEYYEKFEAGSDCAKLDGLLRIVHLGDPYKFPFNATCNDQEKIDALMAPTDVSGCCAIFDHWEFPDDTEIPHMTDNPLRFNDYPKLRDYFCQNKSDILAVYRYPRYVLDFSRLAYPPERYFNMDTTATAITMDCVREEHQYDIPACISKKIPNCYRIDFATMPGDYILICNSDNCYMLPHLAHDETLYITELTDCTGCEDDPHRHPCQPYNPCGPMMAAVAPDESVDETDGEEQVDDAVDSPPEDN